MREFSGIPGIAVNSYAILISIYHIFQVAGVFNQLGIYLMPQPYRSSSLGLILILIFLCYPPKKGQPTKFWVIDALLIGATALSCGYYTLCYESHIWPHAIEAYASPVDLAAGTIIILVILESCRRTMGWTMVIAVAFFIIHVLAGDYFPGPLHCRNYTVPRLIFQLFMGQTGVWGVALGVVSTIIIVFILFGSFLRTFGAGDFFHDLAFSGLGTFRGGAAKGSILASGLFGTINDSTAANVATTGAITIPLMKKMGFKPQFAGAVEAVASNGGQIMPPVMGIVAFIMAEFVGIAYAKICIAAFIPALLYYLGLYMMVDFEAVKSGMPGLPREQLPSFYKTIKEGWHHVLPIIALVIFLVIMGYTPAKSGLLALGILIITSMLANRSSFRIQSITSGLTGVKGMGMVMPACAAAGVIIGCLGTTGLGLSLSSILIDVARGSFIILLIITAISSFILGMGLTSIPCYIILAVLVAPTLVKMGALPVAAHLFVFYFGIVSFITPPVAIAVFVASAIAETNAWKTGWTATRLGIVTFIVPFAFMYDNGLLLRGPTYQIILAIAGAGIAVTCLASGQQRYTFFLGRLNKIQAILFFAAGILLFFPGWIKVMGIVMVAVAIILKFFQKTGLLADTQTISDEKSATDVDFQHQKM